MDKEKLKDLIWLIVIIAIVAFIAFFFGWQYGYTSLRNALCQETIAIACP